MTTTEGDIFNNCEIDEVIALVFDLAGPEGLQELLLHPKVKLAQQELNEAADKLEAAGLIEAANIVAECAARAGDNTLSEIATILNDPIQANRRALLTRIYRQDRITMDELEAAGIDDATLDFIWRSTGKPARQYLRDCGLLHLIQR